MNIERPSRKSDAYKAMEDKPKKTRLIVEIPHELHHTLKKMGAEQERSVKDIVTEILCQHIKS